MDAADGGDRHGQGRCRAIAAGARRSPRAAATIRPSRKSTGGDVEAMQRDSFSSLDDLSGLRRAFAEHKKRGGKMDEAEVFSGSLQKMKLNAGFKP